MAKPMGPSIRQEKVERAAKPASHTGLSPLMLALVLSLTVHLAIAATLFSRPAEPPKARSIIAVEIVAGPPGQNARIAAALAAAPGAGATPKPSDPTKTPASKPEKIEPPKKVAEATKTAQIADANATSEPPTDKAAEPTTPKARATAEHSPKSETAPAAPTTPRLAARAAPPAADPGKSVPKAETGPPETKPDLARPETPEPKATPASPVSAPQMRARTSPMASPSTDPQAPPRTGRLATRLPPKPPRAKAKRATPRAAPPRHAAKRRRTKSATAPRRTARQAGRATTKPSTRRQTASAPAGVYVPPRRGRGRGRNRPPVYPRRAQREGWQGRVLLYVQVAANGRVAAVQVRRTSGHGILDRAAVRAVRGWSFQPAKRGGLPVAGSLVIPVRFRLTN